jgi:hypothetical protein
MDIESVSRKNVLIEKKATNEYEYESLVTTKTGNRDRSSL